MLRDHVIAIIVRRWKQGERSIDSEHIYEELIQQGTTVPEGAMNDLFNDLTADGLIRAGRPQNRDAANEHGSALIGWVSATLL